MSDLDTETKTAGIAQISSAGFAALMHAAADGVIIIDHHGRILSTNPATQELFGYAASELEQQNIRMLMPEPYHSEHDGYIENYRKTKKPKIVGSGRSVSAVKKGGQVFPISLSVGEYAQGEQQYFVGIIHDLTVRTNAQRETRETQENLARVDRISTLGEMATGLAHELNQPLAAVSSYVSACRRRLESGEMDRAKLIDLMNKAEQQAHRAGTIIQRMRAMGKSHESNRVTADINQLIEEIMVLANGGANRRGVQVRLELTDHLPAVSVDPVQIQQVILNLIINAVDASAEIPSEDRQVIVSTEEASNTDEIQVAVRDFGAGISQSVRDRIFDPFYTSKKDGIGMGLSISRSIVDAHQGDLRFANAMPGVCFKMILPIED